VLAPRQGERIIEIGAGTGYYSFALAEALGPAGETAALDSQAEMVGELRRLAAERRVRNLDAVHGDAIELPFGDGTFDGALLVMTLGEIRSQGAALRELRRVLKPGGRVVVAESPVDPHFVSLSRLLELAEGAGLLLDRSERRLLAYVTRLAPAVSED
jgi:ubiquinone/menaquinone biosynthesis C-methylase UbiE